MDVIRINASGKHFVVKRETLQRYPGTRLAQLTTSSPEYNPRTNEYFFDRNAKLVPFILDLYRTGDLHLPPNVCPSAIKAELFYWGIPEEAIADCCWKSYFHHLKDMRIFNIVKVALDNIAPCGDNNSFRQRLWLTVSHPDYSAVAKIWHLINLAFSMVTIIVFLLYTHPSFRQEREITLESNRTVLADDTNMMKVLMTDPHPVLFWLDVASLIFFTFKYAFQLIICPSVREFVCQFFNVIELVVLFDIWVVLLSNCFDAEETLYAVKEVIYVLRFGFGLRVFRMFHLAKHYKIMQVLYLTLRGSCRHMTLLIAALAMAVIIFATAIFAAEGCGKVNTFPSIPDGIWWAIITMTTVGYGDYAPKTFPGKVVGSACAVAGLIIISIPIAIIASSFDSYYQNMEATDHSLRREMTIFGKHGEDKKPHSSAGASRKEDTNEVLVKTAVKLQNNNITVVNCAT